MEGIAEFYRKCNEVFSTCQKTPGGHDLLVVARKECQSLAECLLGVTVLLLDQVVSSLREQGDHRFVDLFQCLESVARRGFDHLLGLGNTDLLERDSRLVLDHADELLLL